MGKYIEIFKVNLKRSLMYRANFNMGLVGRIIEGLTLFYVWKSVYMAGSVKGYSFMTMVSYIILSMVIAPIFFPRHIFKIGDLVKTGKLSQYILKPYSFMGDIFAAELANKVVDGVILSIIIILNYAMMTDDTETYFFLSVASLLINFLCMFVFGMLVGNIVFYLTDTWPLKPLYNALIMLAGGGYFPLDLLPKGVYNVVRFSPFPLFSYVNIKNLQGNIGFDEIIFYINLSVFYLVLFLVLHQIIWNISLKRYEEVLS